MNPPSGETSGINLPPPVGEQPARSVDGVSRSPEQRPSQPESAPRTGVAKPSMPAFDLSGVQQAAQPPGRTPSQASPPSDGQDRTLPAADDDKIEKEWVDKIRRVIEQTRHDPHQQSEKLTMVKADYMKQRYNKVIKVEK